MATVDYDYSKAYGGGGDTSVSSAGGTFGSNTQGQSQAVAATAGALGTFEDGESLDKDPNSSMKQDLINIFAPPGKLGVVIDTPVSTKGSHVKCDNHKRLFGFPDSNSTDCLIESYFLSLDRMTVHRWSML